jgi:hypothetical protein
MVNCVRIYKGGEGKVHLRTGHEGPEREYRYSFTLSLTTALDGVGWSTPRPGRFLPPGKTRDPSYRRLGGPHCRSGRVRKISHPTGVRSPDRRTPTHCNLISRSMTVLPPVLSPSSILPPPSHSLYSPIPQANAYSGLKKVSISLFNFFKALRP